MDTVDDVAQRDDAIRRATVDGDDGDARELLRSLQAGAVALAVHDEPPVVPVVPAIAVSARHDVEVELLRRHLAHIVAAAPDLDEMLARRRAWLETYGADIAHGCEIRPLTGAVRGEWVVPPDADPTRRLLYLHGGSFQIGSPASHRSLTTRLAEQAGVVVLSLDYRLAPEHSRQDALDDVDAGWSLLCEAGPDGPAPLVDGYVAGDSAGGNLALGLLQRVRDGGGRVPEAAVALSGTLDTTYSSPSMRTNIDSDVMLGDGYGTAMRRSHALLVLQTWAQIEIRPDDPRVSPLLGALHDLPPTLLQASDAEMLRDDSIRYARAAAAAGSPTRLELWPAMLHVWQMFPELPEAQDAIDSIVAFLDEHRRP